MQRTFKTRHFSRWMRKTELTDAALCKAVAEMAQGLIDADLGGGVVKKRIGLAGRGKQGGARTLVATNQGTRWFLSLALKKTSAPISPTMSWRRCKSLLAGCWPAPDKHSMLLRQMVHYRRFAMNTPAKPKSRILEAVHETAVDLHRLGFIDKRKMQKLDVLCLDPVPDYDSARIRALRESLKLSQAVLAAVLNTSASTVRKWEGGEKHPSGPSAKLLNLLERKGLEAVL